MFFFVKSPCFVRLIRKKYKGAENCNREQNSPSPTSRRRIEIMNVPLAYVQLISALASDVDLELPINGIISSIKSIFD